MWKRRIGKKIVETLCEKDFRSSFQEEVFHARGEVVFLQGALITDLIISFMYEQRPFHSRIRVNKPNFRLNPFNGGAAYLLTGRWTCVHGSLLSLSLAPLSSRFVISTETETTTRRCRGKRRFLSPRGGHRECLLNCLVIPISPSFPPLPPSSHRDLQAFPQAERLRSGSRLLWD